MTTEILKLLQLQQEGEVHLATIGGFGEEQHQYRQRLEDAKRRLASCQTRAGGLFQFSA